MLLPELCLACAFNIGTQLKNKTFGLLWVAMYMGSMFPFFYYKSGIIDHGSIFYFPGVYYFIKYTGTPKIGNPKITVFYSGLFLGLAMLTKGPVALLIFLLTFAVYLIWNKFKLDFKWSHVLIFTVTLIVSGGLWFILQIASGNLTVIQDFIAYQIRLFQTQDAGHGGFFGYHFVMVFIGAFPATVFALPTFRKSILSEESDENVKHFFRWMMMLFWVVIILFTIVKTKIVHYSSMTYYPVTFFAAWYVYQIIAERKKLPAYVRVLTLFVSAIYGAAIIAIPFFDKFKHQLIPYVKDEFAVGNLQATANWHGVVPFIGVILIVATVLFFIRAKKQLTLSTLSILLIGTLIYISSTMFFIVPQVEKYTQAAAIEFYKSKVNENCYIKPTFKSYAHYFYSERKIENNMDDLTFLTTDKLDKPCYFVVKNTKKAVARFTENTPDAERLYDKNGFVFYVRK